MSWVLLRDHIYIYIPHVWSLVPSVILCASCIVSPYCVAEVIFYFLREKSRLEVKNPEGHLITFTAITAFWESVKNLSHKRLESRYPVCCIIQNIFIWVSPVQATCLAHDEVWINVSSTVWIYCQVVSKVSRLEPLWGRTRPCLPFMICIRSVQQTNVASCSLFSLLIFFCFRNWSSIRGMQQSHGKAWIWGREGRSALWFHTQTTQTDMSSVSILQYLFLFVTSWIFNTW